MRKALTLAVLLQTVLAGAALAGLVDGTGEVTEWGITPFTQPNVADTFDGTRWRTIQNDYAPIDYPGGVGYRPSPGGALGETFDLEEMYVGDFVTETRVLLVGSNGPTADAVGTTWFLGDLFITLGDQQFGIVTSGLHQGLTVGSIYRLLGDGDTVGLQDADRSYAGNTRVRANDYGPDDTVPNIVGPLSIAGDIDPSQLLGMAGIQSDTFDYGGGEDGTYLLQYAFDPTGFGLTEEPDTWSTQITWGCGNDVIRVKGDMPYIPEPATFGMLMFGMALTYFARRRNRQAR